MNQISSADENDALIAAATEQKYDQARREGLKFDVPETLPRSEHLKHRYDPLLDQFTKMLMRHGKLSAAQKVSFRVSHI